MAESCCSTPPLTTTRMRAAAATGSFSPTIAVSASAPKNPPRSRLLRLSSATMSPQLLRSSSSYSSQSLVRYRCISSFKMLRGIHLPSRAQASSVGAGSYGGEGETGNASNFGDSSSSEITSQGKKPLSGVNYQLSIAGVLLVSALAFSLVVFLKGGPTALISTLAKSGFTAAFTLIFVSEIGDKTFFIAALLAMQYDKAMVLLGSMGALSLMTILSVIIGRIFNAVPAQFQTTLPIGEYAAVALLAFFGLNSIKNAWELPSKVGVNNNESSELGELVEAEELVKEKVATKLTNPFEVLWKSFSLVFFAEWGDRSMLATIALGAAQSPWGVAGGAIAGHLVATTIAIIGGAFLANYISEKLVGYLGGILFLVFAVATLFGIF